MAMILEQQEKIIMGKQKQKTQHQQVENITKDVESLLKNTPTGFEIISPTFRTIQDNSTTRIHGACINIKNVCCNNVPSTRRISKHKTHLV
jgi:hypothetical protein